MKVNREAVTYYTSEEFSFISNYTTEALF
ncbi:unnamed protein product [Larinioides sclopetarius]|uniref:Uncharacterized protein n=1 Tax=Larinioides sclopetarius TaxID=280406 RepID=A0AAV2BRL6_9ARAC